MIAAMLLREIELWERVADDEALLAKAARCDASDVAAVSALRRGRDADEVGVALALCAARARAVGKFGDKVAARLVADVAGVEQASSSAVANYKAGRMRDVLGQGTQVADLCCGIGGDSMALCDAGLEVAAVDHDPLRAWMAGRNMGDWARGINADVADLALDGVAIHLDPARRDEATGKRMRGLNSYMPGPAVIGRLIQQAPAAALKLSPAVDLNELEEQPWPGEIEFISDHGRLVQAVLWAGGFAREPRKATLISDDGVHTIAGQPTPLSIRAAERYLYAFDPAIERAGLIGPLSSMVDAPALHAKLGLLTSDRVIESPWLTGFELIERMGWRPKRVKQWLAANDGGLVEVKTRGKACDPDREQRQLRGQGSTTYTVFVLRFDMKVQALIARRL